MPKENSLEQGTRNSTHYGTGSRICTQATRKEPHVQSSLRSGQGLLKTQKSKAMACIKLKLNFHREGGFIQQNPSKGKGKVTTVQIGQRKIHYKISSPHSRKHQSQFHPLLTALNQAGYYGFHWTICSRHLSQYSTSQIPGYFDFQEANEAKTKKEMLAIFLPQMANSQGWGLLSCQIPWGLGGDEKRGQMRRPPSTLQHFSLIAQSNSAILSILMCDFLFQLTSSFVIALGF